MANRGISRAAINRFKLGFSGETGDRHANRLAIPYLTPAGPWLIKYRCIADHNCKDFEHHSKYLNDGDVHLFNAPVLKTAERVVVTEGELDAIAVTMAGAAAVAFPGANNWQSNPYFRWCFDSCEQIIVVADGDEPLKDKSGVKKKYGAGEEAGRKVKADLANALPDADVSLVVLPIPYDSNQYIAEHGDLEYLERIGWI